MSSRDVKILEACKKRGIRPQDLGKIERNLLVLGTMSTMEKAGAIGSAFVAEVEVRLIRLQVLPATENDRRTKCSKNTCGFFRIQENGDPWCIKCGCGGRGLKNRWRKKKARCPLPEPLWVEET